MNDLFPVIILAGGLATRLHPVTQTIPKSLVSICDTPFIDYQLQRLSQNGIRKVILCVGFLGERIEKHAGDGKRFNLQIHYSYDGPNLLGTAGAIQNALPLITSDEFFVLYGDSFLTCDFKSVQMAFQKQKKHALMTIFQNQGAWDTSNVEYRNGSIITYDKVNRNERMHYIDYGLGVFTKHVFNNIPSPYDLFHLYQTLLMQNQLGSLEVFERFYEVGSFAGIKDFEYYLRQNSVMEVME